MILRIELLTLINQPLSTLQLDVSDVWNGRPPKSTVRIKALDGTAALANGQTVEVQVGQSAADFELKC